MERVKQLLKTRAVLVLSASAAILSACFVPPDQAYWGYLDFRVLSLLFCLMAVVAGLQRIGLFGILARRMVMGARNTRGLCAVLVMLCFFSSMLITNDVALITFVPFAILVLTVTGQQRHLIFVVVMQTVAANLGSMLTPVGNPQNLYLYSYYQINPAAFFAVTLPVTLLGLTLVALACLLVRGENIEVHFGDEPPSVDKRRLWLYGALFVLCLLTVVHVLPYPLVLGVVLLCILLFDRPVLRKVDYGLLLTFVCFFLFVGNLGRIQPVRELLAGLLHGRELLVSAGLSQIISNVPAAVLLSGFTENARALLLGTNVGGMGTIIASLASLISFQLYCKTEKARPLRYLGVFTAVNAALFCVLAGFSLLLL